ncbi:MAG: hypothetical protein K0U93_23805, partial [Gammaproteobacteria bacterium]|nr:hypothetical protein [Gammaproteobacteria bacterium]
ALRSQQKLPRSVLRREIADRYFDGNEHFDFDDLMKATRFRGRIPTPQDDGSRREGDVRDVSDSGDGSPE